MIARVALGRPLPAARRGGDCYLRDLGRTRTRNVHAPHHFPDPANIQLRNGLLRATMGPVGVPASLTLEAWQPPALSGDTFHVQFPTGFDGTYSSAGWVTLGQVTIDSPTTDSALVAVRTLDVSAQWIILQLVIPELGDAFVSLRRGERFLRIQHGSHRRELVGVRRVRMNYGTVADLTTESEDPLETESGVGLTVIEGELEGTPARWRTEETSGPLRRFVASLDIVVADSPFMSLTTTRAVSVARFGAGVGSDQPLDLPSSLHSQLGDASVPVPVLELESV